ncbi:hypothetical protein [Pelagibius sp. Alg239-R121]|uniref:hypothetical protein n=1 Tax=Pelagibius sp. Alg239-R121 TaxID=2993448 RepID=UPI0024A6CDEA|nr:hypothetical protein [Pelagibius sp. Alg239-R121]
MSDLEDLRHRDTFAVEDCAIRTHIVRQGLFIAVWLLESETRIVEHHLRANGYQLKIV